MNRSNKLVVALGGNALEEAGLPPTAQSQLAVIKKTCAVLADLCAAGYQLAVVHGNGPQVGRILLASETAKDVTPSMPYDVCGAMSQGYIGYQIQQSLREELGKREIGTPVVSLVTQVLVDAADPAFQNPTKPIGIFYSEEEAGRLAAQNGYTMKEDAGRGWRRVVPSPIPQEIVELDVIRRLCGHAVVIAAGGGGIPVVRGEDGGLEGVAAVIDKDNAAELLAEEIDADTLLILTAVDRVAIHWGKPEQRALEQMTVAEAERFIAEGHFAKGSMLPKVEAALKFVRSAPGRRAVIASLAQAKQALAGQAGTELVAGESDTATMSPQQPTRRAVQVR